MLRTSSCKSHLLVGGYWGGSQFSQQVVKLVVLVISYLLGSWCFYLEFITLVSWVPPNLCHYDQESRRFFKEHVLAYGAGTWMYKYLSNHRSSHWYEQLLFSAFLADCTPNLVPLSDPLPVIICCLLDLPPSV